MGPLHIKPLKYFIVLVFSAIYSQPVFSQLTVTPNQTASVLSSALAGPGITITTPVLTCPGVANGTFTVTPGTVLGTGATLFGINNGILLTTGKSIGAAGLESTLASTNNGAPGDPTLTTLAGATTYDACILEFDVTPIGDTIRFNYEFGSEEYNHSTCGPYNDAFAFYISGPGIVGTQNMALVPGTTIPVTVNSVNSGVPGPGYTLANCTIMGPGSPFTTYYVDNTGGTHFTYKGFTTKLTAWSAVTPCATYHLKLTIADAGNSIYDSGVFIEEGSLTTPSITGILSLCVGGSTTLSYSVSGGTWTSGSPGVASVGASTGVVTGISGGVATISYTYGIGCTATTTVTVSPSTPITGTTTVCAGNTTTLSDATPGGTWSSGTTSVATVGSLTGIVTGVSAGTSMITYTMPSGCMATTVVTVQAGPAAIAGPATLCAGGTVILTDATGGGTWSSSSTGVATIGSLSGVVSGIAAGTATITYTLSSGCYATIAITVSPLPLPIGGITTVCAGSTITLSDASTGGTWSSGSTTTATINPATGVLSGVSAGLVTITYTLSTGCFATRIITVNPAPGAIGGVALVCIGGTTTLSNSVAGGTWSSSASPVATVGSSSGVVTGISAGTAVVTYSLSAGCYSTITVTVNTLFTSTLYATICSGNSYTFAGTSYTVAGSYSHTFVTAHCDSIVTLNLAVNPPSATSISDSICQGQSYTFAGSSYSASGAYIYHATNVNGCDSVVTLHLYVKPAPPAPSVISPVSYCQNQSAAPLFASGQNLLWYTVSSGGAGSTTAPTPATSTPGTTSYYVSQTIGGCESQLAAIQVIVSPVPVASIIPGRTSLCSHDTMTLSAGIQSSVTYLWSLPQGVGIDYGTASDPGPITVQCDSAGDYFVKLTVIGNGGACIATDSIRIHVIVAPELTFYSRPEVCVGDTVVVALIWITPGITNFVWNFGDASVITETSEVNGGPYKVSWQTPGIHFITSYASIGSQCASKTVVDSVDVVALPAPKISGAYGNVCEGDSLLFSTPYVAGDMYLWSPDHFFQNANQASIWGRILAPGNSYVTVTETSPVGCKGEDSILVSAQSCCSLLFPNAFAPDATNSSDRVFRAITDGHQVFHVFRIVNRWGQTVFQTSNDRDGWDGRLNGVPQDLGVYYYYVKYDCDGKTVEQKGDVTLIR